MHKKLIAMIMVFAMLVSISPAVAAEDAPVKPTVEEILTEYHRKLFEAQNEQEISTASANSRSTSGSGQTLEQEAGAQLTEAGYEVYNVTAENYLALESSLKCDFTELGLDPDGSYIIVISGEESEEDENESNTPTPRSLILPPHLWDDPTSGSSFSYNYNGVTYTMRYATITSLDEPEFLYVKKDYVLSNATSIIELLGGLADVSLVGVVDKITSNYTIVPVTSLIEMALLFVDWLVDTGLEELDPNSVTIHSSTRWTRSYIQVRNPDNGNWHTSQCSSYAISIVYCDAGLVWNPQTGKDEPSVGEAQEINTYSAFYNDSSTRMERAARGYLSGGTLYDRTGDIHFYFANSEGLVVIGTDKEPLFTHEEDISYLLPLIQNS